jgi:hypothetical protein
VLPYDPNLLDHAIVFGIQWTLAIQMVFAADALGSTALLFVFENPQDVRHVAVVTGAIEMLSSLVTLGGVFAFLAGALLVGAALKIQVPRSPRRR